MQNTTTAPACSTELTDTDQNRPPLHSDKTTREILIWLESANEFLFKVQTPAERQAFLASRAR